MKILFGIFLIFWAIFCIWAIYDIVKNYNANRKLLLSPLWLLVLWIFGSLLPADLLFCFEK